MWLFTTIPFQMKLNSTDLLFVVSKWFDNEPLPSPEEMVLMIDDFIDYGLNFEENT